MLISARFAIFIFIAARENLLTFLILTNSFTRFIFHFFFLLFRLFSNSFVLGSLGSCFIFSLISGKVFDQ